MRKVAIEPEPRKKENEMKDALDEIFTDKKEVNADLLASILKGFVKINTETNTIIFPPEIVTKLSLKDRLLLFLVSRKALKFKNKIKVEEVTPAEIINETNLKPGSVHPTLKILKAQGLVIARGGKYFVPNYQLPEIKRFLKEGIWMKK